MTTPAPTNILLITADDLNWDSLGAYGCATAGTTPHLDALAQQGVRFEHAHVTIAVCQPSRSAMLTGRYPHRSGGEGFFHLRRPDVPALPELLKQGGYRVGILGKVGHSTPHAAFQWNLAYDQPELGFGRSPRLYREHALAFLRGAREARQPFFLMANLHDPHRPFFGNDKREWYEPQAPRPPAALPSRVFEAGEVAVPGFLPDLPDVRREMAEYYSSVRRCDDGVAALLDALRQSGAESDTLVVFLSDNGMAFPFAKTNCYLHSTKTPLLVRFPGATDAGRVDAEHFVSGIDLTPTFLELAGLPCPEGVDGRSFVPLLRGERQPERDRAFTQFHQTAGKGNYPMRCVQTRRWGYIYNAWANGERAFHNESQSGRTFAAMRDAAAGDPAIANRVHLFLHRTAEELYDFAADPHALDNRVTDPACAEELRELRASLEAWMEQTGDPALEAFRHRDSPDARERFLERTKDELGGWV